jgi:hypothetical protein
MMDILLLIAIIAVVASGLFVAAATFNARARENFTPLINDAVRPISESIEAASERHKQQVQLATDEVARNTEQVQALETAAGELRRQVQAIRGEVQRNAELVGLLQAASGEFQRQVQAIAGELREDRELAGHRLEAVHGDIKQRFQAVTAEVRRHPDPAERLGQDLARLDHQVARLGEALAEQGARIAGVYRYVIRREMPAGSSAASDLLLLAMLEAESYVDGKGWGGRPRLYALTAQAPAAAAGDEPASGMSDARPGALVPVEQDRLPDGDLTAALAGVRWPADVVGCVLVTELAALPPGRTGDAPAAAEWTSTHPDERPARLTVGVSRSGEHVCGLRVKGEDEMQVRNELAGNLVTALLGTF